MTKQELKQLISELDTCDSQIESIQHMVSDENINEENKQGLMRQFYTYTSRRDSIQDILDASGEDIEALRNERI